ncbi:MAG: hypothetical protein NZ853_07795 [Leptospiraceae bacterium]|nr:hypothetical protein [Leptospiraceae bacterium]MDW7976926.1 hypothetical protein [Leptospiraceae bacterium]
MHWFFSLLIVSWQFLYPQNLYIKTAKAHETFFFPITTDTYWVWEFPYDMQYRVEVFQNLRGFEGKNLGIEKFWIKSVVLQNRKGISQEDWDNFFLKCRNKAFGELVFHQYEVCEKNQNFLLRGYVVDGNQYHIMYMLWKKDLTQEEQEKIKVFLYQIRFHKDSSKENAGKNEN